MANLYQTFQPNYYSTLAKNQQSSLVIDNLFFYVADGLTEDAVANTQPKSDYDQQQVINQILYGGRVLPENMLPMIRNIPWQSGKVFTKYDSRDPLLVQKDTYCLSSNRSVYKCIDNNKNSPSTNEPNSNIPGIFNTADGYRWMYMYKLTDYQLQNYSVYGMVPIIPDPVVTNAAVRGTVSTIDVISGGNYTKLNNGTIQQVLSSNLFRISDFADSVSGAYNKMTITIDSGTGQGQLSVISSYIANTSGKFVTTATAITPATSSTYSIVPTVKISGNGIGAVAKAIMSDNSIDRVEIVNSGSEYSLATAEPVSEDLSSTPAQLSVNLSPLKGHGADIVCELFTDHVMLSLNLDNYNLDPSIPVNDLTFSKVGLIRGLLQENNPTQLYTDQSFSNMFVAQITPSFGQYSKGDTIYIFGNQPNPPYAKIIHATPTHIIGVYQMQVARFSSNQYLVNQDGVVGLVTDIIQPDVKFIVSDVVAQINTDTIDRSENNNETLQILIKIRNY